VASSFFDSFLFRPLCGEDDWSRMTRAPLLRRLLGGGDAGSFLMVEGAAHSYLMVVGVDPPDLDADREPDEEEDGAILLGIQELPCRRDTVAATGGGIPRTGEFPSSMCASTFSRVRPGALHHRLRPAALFLAGGGGGPS
jgi:hypothetical protein